MGGVDAVVLLADEVAVRGRVDIAAPGQHGLVPRHYRLDLDNLN